MTFYKEVMNPGREKVLVRLRNKEEIVLKAYATIQKEMKESKRKGKQSKKKNDIK